MDLKIHRFSEKWRPGWQAFVKAAPGATLAHAEPWLAVLSRSLGHEDRSLIAERGGNVSGVLPLMQLKHWLLGTFHISLPWLDYGGVLAGDGQTARALLDAARLQAGEDRASFVELRSGDPVFADLPVRNEKVTFLVELGDVEAVWRRLEPQIRYKVRKAQKAGLTCQFGREEFLLEFYGVFARNMRDLGTPVWDIILFQNILEAFPESADVALIQLNGKTIGGALVFSFRDTVDILSSSSLRSYFHLAPNNLLNWEVIRRACETGFRYFDFGRSTIDSGTYQFKKQWGGVMKPLHWQYVLLNGKNIPQLNPSNPRLKILIEVWKRLPLGIANWLGPHIVRHLP